MKIVCLSFTKQGAVLCSKIVKLMHEREGHTCIGYAIEKYCVCENLIAFNKLSSNLTKELFENYQALIFIGSTGIAIRKVAALLKSKTSDPAVLCIDEKGTFVIPLISGHIGGANKLSGILAGLLNSTSVITTATDTNHKLSIDTWAVDNNFAIVNPDMIKKISAAILDELEVGVYCDDSNIDYPPELSDNIDAEYGVCISYDVKKKPFEYTLNLVPKNVIVGLGCRKDIEFRLVEQLFLNTLIEYGLPVQGVSCIASIDLKKDEPALLQLSEKYKINFITYTSAELNLAAGEFQASDFVKQTTGVDNVCERAGFLASCGAEQVCQKICQNGVTISLFRSVNNV